MRTKKEKQLEKELAELRKQLAEEKAKNKKSEKAKKKASKKKSKKKPKKLELTPDDYKNIAVKMNIKGKEKSVHFSKFNDDGSVFATYTDKKTLKYKRIPFEEWKKL